MRVYSGIPQFTKERVIHSVTTVRRANICQFHILKETNVHGSNNKIN